jgi:tetratricopeptide (TPR) repeat protein
MLGAEMSSVLPLKVDIDFNADLEGFEVTSEQIAAAAKYIVAVAYFLSNAPREAVQLLQSLQQTAPSVEQRQLPQSRQLSELVERRLCDFQLHHASVLHFEWRHSHQRHLIEEVERILQSLPLQSKQRGDVRNLQAMCAFILRGDTTTAQDTFVLLSRAEPGNPIWVYSLAFLCAYDGDLEKAHRLYKKAFELDDSAALSIEIEEFVAWCAEAHSERPQLFYCLGYINGRQKKDAQRALSDFKRFIELADPNLYRRRIDLARRFIVRLEQGEWISS